MEVERIYITRDQTMSYVCNPRFRSACLYCYHHAPEINEIGIIVGYPNGEPKYGVVENCGPAIPMVPLKKVIVVQDILIPDGVEP